MAALVSRRFNTVEELNVFLHGGLIGGPVFNDPKVFGLHGKTLVFNAPAGITVTFADPTEAGLDLEAIVTQIKAGAVALTARYLNRRLVMEYATPGTAVNLDATGSANFKFGFDATVDTVGTFYHAWDGAAPRLVELSHDGTPYSMIAVTEE